jgi:hypothetical protein
MAEINKPETTRPHPNLPDHPVHPDYPAVPEKKKEKKGNRLKQGITYISMFFGRR